MNIRLIVGLIFTIIGLIFFEFGCYYSNSIYMCYGNMFCLVGFLEFILVEIR